ncbi:4-alpha-glucanotransferase [Dietzia aurantiaca]|uniref:4-alpha-glucanotransferase n=1 Tax=Dietzia aurantiaca TaxID=983873 RepID=UPI001E433EA0|nr:4-alpha-glucanotransferase [Dietzia aurantiaca]MCD2263000.1 4-alpha-glucanotransferase [Dietzia aurantiaca]
MTATSDVPPALPEALVELAAECGVATGYTDAHGVHRDVPERTVRAVLAAMGIGAGSRADVAAEDDDHDDDNAATRATDTDDRAALEEVRLAPWRRVIAPTVVATEGATRVVPIHVPLGANVTVSAHLEETPFTTAGPADPIPLLPLSGDRIQREVDGTPMEQISVSVPGDLPAGWHRLRVVVVDPGVSPTDAATTALTDTSRPDGAHPGTTYTATLLVAPASIPVPAGLDERRAVGLAAQLYQVRSATSWGMGDLADLMDLATWGGRELGADFVLVNPMHAGEPFPPVSPSPYLPTTRRFASPLYLRPELLPEYADLPESERARVDELAGLAAGTEANRSDLLDRDASWAAKVDALRLVFAVPCKPDRAAEFDRFVRDGGPGLRSFATWCALAGEYGPDWANWTTDLRDPGSEAVDRFASAHTEEIEFHQWLQWVTGEQRARAQRSALDAGMRLGILHDLAVGVHPSGADAWSLNRSLARRVSVGAPPDIYNQRGQDWSQPPLRPDALADNGYRQFRDIVRAALRDAGGVRIDHILGLFRLWWIPAGSPPTDGTYVHYDSDAMLAVLTLEASRAGAVVVGEDLGTVAPGVRESLSERGVLGASVMWFEQTEDAGETGDTDSAPARPLPPEEYRRLCMASVTTHDLAPTAGYIDLVHVDIRDELGQLTRDVADERRDAAAEVAGFVSDVRERGLLEGDSPDDLIVAMHAFLATSPSLLLTVSLADLVGDRRPVNMPGTSTEYPNWSVPLADAEGRALLMEDVVRSGLPKRVFAAVGGVGGG